MALTSLHTEVSQVPSGIISAIFRSWVREPIVIASFSANFPWIFLRMAAMVKLSKGGVAGGGGGVVGGVGGRGVAGGVGAGIVAGEVSGGVAGGGGGVVPL